MLKHHALPMRRRASAHSLFRVSPIKPPTYTGRFFYQGLAEPAMATAWVEAAGTDVRYACRPLILTQAAAGASSASAAGRPALRASDRGAS